MGLFNFKKKKIEEPIKVEVTSKESTNEDKFSFLCINLDNDEYSFIVKLNTEGKITVTKDLNKEEIDDLSKVNEIKELVNKNLSKLKDLVTRVSPSAKKDNMIQVEVSKNKYVLFKNDDNSDLDLFYDMIIHDLTKILDINKSYSNIKNNISFEYPNKYEKIPTDDLSKYCLLGNSDPLLMLNDSNGNILTFEILDNKEGFVDKLIKEISEYSEYKKLTTMDLSSTNFEINSVIVNHVKTSKVEAINFITYDNKCIIFTFMVGGASEVDIDNLLKDKKIMEMMAILSSFKILDEDAINA